MIPALMAAALIAYPSFPGSQGYTAVARWLEREAGAPRRDLVAVRDNFAWIMTPEARARQPGQPVVLRLETLDADAWRRLNGRSAIVRLDADCTARKATIRNADVYQASNLLGGVSRNVEPSALPVLADTLVIVADGLCRNEAQPPPVVTAASAPPLPVPGPVPGPVPAPVPPPVRPAPAAVAVAAPPPPPAAPQPPRPQTVAIAPPRPAPAAPPPTPPPTPPRSAPKPAPQPPPAAHPVQTPATPAAMGAAGSSETVVQIGAFSSTGAAMVALRELVTAQPKLMAGKLQRLEPVGVAGGQLHRALLTGFANLAEAEAFCRTLVAGGRPCAVRPSG